MTAFDTRAVRGGRADLHALGVHVPPIDLSTTNPLPSLEEGGASYEAMATGGEPTSGGAVYQRLWNPTVARFEDALAGLEGAEGAVAFASGMAALSAVLVACVAAGTPHVVAVRPLYGGSDHLLTSGLLGTSVTWVDAEGVAAALRPDTGVVLVETPANPTLDLVDIHRLVAAAGEVPVLVDSTFATPVLQRPLEHSAALVLHSATKFLGGHGDAMGGVVAGPTPWVRRLRQVRALTGGLLHPEAAYLLHRGLQTLPVRVLAQQASAVVLAQKLASHPMVERVLQPEGELVGPGRQMRGPGATFSFEVVGGYEAARTVVEGCRLATLAVSLGGTETLVQHPASLTHRPVVGERRPGEGLVRVSVGLEDVDDLVVDLLQALDGVRPR
jgi:cystathionine beta-lyase/cystathionine gamma-synthase